MQNEISRRRTFAIISHPDAGKTTLTEKMLLYSGAVQLAGSVRSRKNQRTTTSDWMELERKRGISVSSTVLQFDYQGYQINLLDTPGHKDFSEDTYRVLTAVDAVVMVLDAAKGIEAQTQKLFEVCRQRGVPIFTFINKCDRPAKGAIELLDEIENVLQLKPFPVNWPIGDGADFKGLFDRLAKQVHLFERTTGGAYIAPVEVGGISDNFVRERVPEGTLAKITEELEMLDMAGAEFDSGEILAGHTTPVFFGSAMNNFGIELILNGFLQHAPPPQGRPSNGEFIKPSDEAFSGFIFKIQANMDPKHRDRIAYIRICSGKFERDMTVYHSRTGKKVRLASSHRLFGKERETVNKAYAGDIIGLVGHADFGIGDTLTTNKGVEFHEIPRFTPESFSYLHNADTGKFKQFRQGLEQLLQEGAIQCLSLKGSAVAVPVLAAVGPLQFDVVQFRLESEYNAVSRLEPASWQVVRWLPDKFSEEEMDKLSPPTGSRFGWDSDGNPVLLFASEWAAGYFQQNNESLKLAKRPPRWNGS
ncbi:MAG: peptide chain release factor 3 [Verrucomicrobiota bacterium]|jgi:peptide chain release factor 3|nr:peptide chain release factor 3 [Verrucomicrobiota bacterium]MDP6251857.1 peptide chain release factor 3 [Verrucomicrobiota bacterium]MDP7441475.1 peptide chain release factor 3 [Verrucomicrobiota bacterium]|tara:strand:+ start:2247 stop:3842 length:1596 start_codon:yes stop_codon:yes gene_type:complete